MAVRRYVLDRDARPAAISGPVEGTAGTGNIERFRLAGMLLPDA